MTPEELEQYLALTLEIERLEAALKAAVTSKQGLAQALYERYGKEANYKVGDEMLVISPTKTGTYYFVRRVRWSKEARAAKAEKRRLDRIARLQSPLLGKPGTDRVIASESDEEAPPVAAQEPTQMSGTLAPTPRLVEVTATLSMKSTPQIDSGLYERKTLPDGTPWSWGALEDCQGELLHTDESKAKPLDSVQEAALDIEDCASPIATQVGSGAEPRIHALSPEANADRPTPVSPAIAEVTDPYKLHLPIVGEVDKPVEIEPRLIQIQEPSQEPDDLDPLDELLRDL
jgi:hypothetical protein